MVAWIIGGSWLVFSKGLIFTKEVKFSSIISPNIYLNDPLLSSTIVGYFSTYDIRDAEVFSNCNTDSEFLEKHEWVYYFRIGYIGDDCKNPNIVLKHQDQTLAQTQTKLKIVSKSGLFNVLSDNSSENIKNFYASLQKIIKKNTLYAHLKWQEIGEYIHYRKKQRIFQEAQYQADLAEFILSGRSKKYTSPVPGKTLSTAYSKIPNAGRSYRADYTDGIHHGWDIAGDLWEDVVALDDGIIVRIVEGFQFSDLTKILKTPNLSEEEKLKNLDTLRWNQVWLKTTKGEVVFYSHLKDVYDTFAEGDMVKRGTPLGTIGVTWVPEVWYDDYHLHFAIHVNPYDRNLAGSYNLWDYMKWDWKFQWETFDYILQNQGELFE